MRLFVAIDLSEGARAAVAEEQQRLRRTLGPSPAKWVRAEQMHMTLVFIGEADQARADTIAGLLSAEIPLPPFRLAFGGLGLFPVAGPPRVLWLGTLDGTSKAVDLQRRVVGRLEPAGVQREARPFHPHLTLARWPARRRSERPPLGSARAAVAAVEVDAVTLYHSHLSAAGSSYISLARAQLSCR